MRRIISLTAMIFLAGCASAPVISSNPVQTVTNAVLPPGGTVVTGLQNAAFNLDSAIALKILPATDPVDGCAHGVLQAIGQDVGQTPAPPAPQFQSKITDLISGGSVAYILAQQAKQIVANGGSIVPPNCEQIIGHLVILGINAPANAIISAAAGVLP